MTDHAKQSAASQLFAALGEIEKLHKRLGHAERKGQRATQQAYSDRLKRLTTERARQHLTSRSKEATVAGLVADGWSSARIAEHLGLTVSEIRRIRAEAGV